MIRIPDIQAALRGMIGFSQPNDPNYPQIDPALTTSTSGLYVDKIHPICTIENITNCAPEFSRYTYPAFNNAKTYPLNSIVSFNSLIYKAVIIVNTGGGNPDVNTNAWQQIDPLSNWLQNIYDNAASGLITLLLQNKKAAQTNRTLLDKQFLYQGVGSLNDRIVGQSRFVGITFQISQQDGLYININNIGIQLDGMLESLPIYLYHSSQDDPIATTTINVSKTRTFQWFDLPPTFVLKAKSKLYDPNGIFFIGYYEDDLVGVQAIHRQSDFTRQPCAGCDGITLAAFNAWSKFVKASTMWVPFSALALPDRTLFDNNRICYNNTTNYGINVSLSVFCDLTDMFIENKNVYADVLAMKVCLDLLQNIAFNQRINAISDKTKALAMAELDSAAASGSFMVQFNNALAGMNLDFSRLSKNCLPCVERKGFKFNAI